MFINLKSIWFDFPDHGQTILDSQKLFVHLHKVELLQNRSIYCVEDDSMTQYSHYKSHLLQLLHPNKKH